MKISQGAAFLFAPEISRAKKRGMTHYAKAVGCPAIRFGITQEKAKEKAKRDARRLAREWGCPTIPPEVESGELY
jgi:hypothetical protein